MDLRRISPAITRQKKLTVVSIEEVKAQARVTDDSENDLIADYIEAAYDFLSGPSGWLNGYCLLPETYQFYAERWLRDGFDMPLRPLRAVTTPVLIEVLGTDDEYTAVDADLYSIVWSEIDFPSVRPMPRQIWPGAYRLPHPHTYRFTIEAGHATGPEVPSPIRLAMKMLAAHWYANRETTGPAGRTVGEEIHYGLKTLCGRYRLAHDHS